MLLGFGQVFLAGPAVYVSTGRIGYLRIQVNTQGTTRKVIKVKPLARGVKIYYFTEAHLKNYLFFF